MLTIYNNIWEYAVVTGTVETFRFEYKYRFLAFEHILGQLHEPGFSANPGQVASPGPSFSSQTHVIVHSFDWKKMDPGWRPDPGPLSTTEYSAGNFRNKREDDHEI